MVRGYISPRPGDTLLTRADGAKPRRDSGGRKPSRDCAGFFEWISRRRDERSTDSFASGARIFKPVSRRRDERPPGRLASGAGDTGTNGRRHVCRGGIWRFGKFVRGAAIEYARGGKPEHDDGSGAVAGASQPATAGAVLAAGAVVAAIAVVRFLAQKVNWNRSQQRRESENHVPEI